MYRHRLWVSSGHGDVPVPVPRPHGRRSRADRAGGELREAILAATAGLLAEKSFGDLAVGDILTRPASPAAASTSTSTASTTCWPSSSGGPWPRGTPPPRPGWPAPGPTRTPAAALRAGITAGAELWRASAPVLRAIVENWRTDPRLEALWTEQMQTFTDATVAQIGADPRARERLAGQDIPALASALTWLGERLYYLAATGTPPFDDQDTLVATLLHIWTSTLYPDTSTP